MCLSYINTQILLLFILTFLNTKYVSNNKLLKLYFGILFYLNKTKLRHLVYLDFIKTYKCLII